MKTKCTSLACIAVALLLALGTANAREIDIDCDAGDDLGAVLNRLARTRHSALLRGENSADPVVGVTINISGTCVGNFVIATPGLLLQGVGPDPEAAVLQGAAPIQSVTPVVEVRGVIGTTFRDLTVTGGSTGIFVSQASALILGCELRGNGNGLVSRSSETLIGDSVFAENSTGIQSVFADQVSLNDSLVIDNSQVGVWVIGGSSVVIDGGEIRDNLFGLKAVNNSRAFLRQPLIVGDTTGGSHIDALNHSTVTLNDGVIVTGNNDIEIVNQSLLEGKEAAVGVDIQLIQFGRAVLRGTTVDGDLKLQGFSNALLKSGADVSGVAQCDGTSDADCSDGTVGSVSGCGSCVLPPRMPTR